MKNVKKRILFFIISVILNPNVGYTEQPPRQQPEVHKHQAHYPTLKSSSSHTKRSDGTLQNFRVVGKVAFKKGREGGNASIFWEQKGNQYAIRLVGAMGSGSMEIYGRPGFVGLKQSNGESHTAQNAEQLIKKVLGWDIPVSPLRYWLQGKPVPGSAPQKMQVDSMGRLVTLYQYGWRIRYQDYTISHGKALPTHIVLEHGPIRLKFIFREWSS